MRQKCNCCKLYIPNKKNKANEVRFEKTKGPQFGK